mmetsp:Transcript_52571/g.168522  ORF Transcript_52571/g.168522 Transcript_52571/m.168522 type:complete len:238 (-) Transcript_52571:668-1381(-)
MVPHSVLGDGLRPDSRAHLRWLLLDAQMLADCCQGRGLRLLLAAGSLALPPEVGGEARLARHRLLLWKELRVPGHTKHGLRLLLQGPCKVARATKAASEHVAVKSHVHHGHGLLLHPPKDLADRGAGGSAGPNAGHVQARSVQQRCQLLWRDGGHDGVRGHRAAVAEDCLGRRASCRGNLAQLHHCATPQDLRGPGACRGHLQPLLQPRDEAPHATAEGVATAARGHTLQQRVRELQ